MKKTLGYIAFAVFSLLSCLYLTRPVDVVGDRLLHEIRNQSKGKLGLSYDSFELSGLAGLETEGVTIQFGEELQSEFKLDHLDASLSTLSLLVMKPQVEVEFGWGDGAVEMEISPDSEMTELDLSIESLNLGESASVAGLAGVPIGGIVNGEIDSEWVKTLQTLKGEAQLTMTGASVGPGELKGMVIPRISLGTITLRLKATSGKVEIISYKQSGGDIATEISGDVGLRTRLGSSSLNTCIKFKGDPKFLEKNPKLQSALELASIQLKKDSAQFLHVPLGGKMQRPRLRGGLCPSERGSKRARKR